MTILAQPNDCHSCNDARNISSTATSAQGFPTQWRGACCACRLGNFFTMASGKFRNVEHDRSLLDVGLHSNSVNKGFCGVVSLIDGRGFHLSLPCGEKRQVLFSDDLKDDKQHQWRFVLEKCYQSSLQLRVLGAVHQIDNQWYVTNGSLLLRQPGVIRADEIRVYEAFCGGFGGFSRALRFINNKTPGRF